MITSRFHREPLEACALHCMLELSKICTFQQDQGYEDKEPSSKRNLIKRCMHVMFHQFEKNVQKVKKEQVALQYQCQTSSRVINLIPLKQLSNSNENYATEYHQHSLST